MAKGHEILIDLDHIGDDPDVLAKLHECASLMVQSSNRDEVQSGYRILELIDLHMKQQRQS